MSNIVLQYPKKGPGALKEMTLLDFPTSFLSQNIKIKGRGPFGEKNRKKSRNAEKHERGTCHANIMEI